MTPVFYLLSAQMFIIEHPVPVNQPIPRQTTTGDPPVVGSCFLSARRRLLIMLPLRDLAETPREMTDYIAPFKPQIMIDIGCLLYQYGCTILSRCLYSRTCAEAQHRRENILAWCSQLVEHKYCTPAKNSRHPNK